VVELTDAPGPGTTYVEALRVSPARDGSAVVAWLRRWSGGGTASVLLARRVAPDGTRGPVLTLSDPVGRSSYPVLAGSPDGSTLALWVSSDATNDFAEARRVRADDTLGAVRVISPRSATPGNDLKVGDELDIAAMRDGRAVAIWNSFSPVFVIPDPGQVQAAVSGPTLSVPGPPSGVAAAATDAAASVTWSPPASDGGLAVTSYTATVSPGGASCTTAATACTIGGLQNGVPHTVTVTAANSLGTGAPSQASAPFTPLAAAAPVPAPVSLVPVLRLTGVRVAPAVAVRGRPAQTTRLLRIRAKLNRPAVLRVLFERRVRGLRRGRACVAPTRALRRARARACVRFVRAGAVRRAGRARVNTITIRRLRVGRRVLPVGRYRVRVIATAPLSPTRRVSRPLVVRPAAR
jgi:hypothetical protein